MHVDPAQCQVGQKFLMMITGCTGRHFGEVVEANDERYGGRAKVKVLDSNHFMRDTILRGDDYILMEPYDPAKHGAIP